MLTPPSKRPLRGEGSIEILAGQYFDSETGLHYVWNRYYDPKTGRWITADRRSVAEHVRRWRANMGRPNQPPLELNPYAYVANNPLRWIDPTGFGAAGVAGEIIIYVGGAVTVGGIAVGNPIIIGAGLGAVAVGGGLQIYDTYQEEIKGARLNCTRFHRHMVKEQLSSLHTATNITGSQPATW